MGERGRLRVLLGAAPGVGKTFTMLEEGQRLLAEGKDVVVGFLETHGRQATARMAEGLPSVPRARVTYRGVEVEEMDLDAVLTRRPEIALVDELAHTNTHADDATGPRHNKRWQDVEELLAAGIDVISTLNIQHIESLNDVVEQITGVPQRETVPDSVLRTADQIELVDLAPQALRDRLTRGVVYPPDRIDAALSNYFRLGNLTALRELALIWLVDEVDIALQRYRETYGIGATWEARERVVVALTGGPEGETLLRRGARIAARAGGELLAVHVTSQDGLRSGNPAALAMQRALVEQLNGSYHQVAGNDIPAALVEFAKSVNATQLVLGASRRGWLVSALTGRGIGATVVRESGDIDVHMVNIAGAAEGWTLPRITGALTRQRRILGFVLALIGGPLLTAALFPFRGPDAVWSIGICYQLLIVVTALVGGLWPALITAVLSGVTIDYYFIEPYSTVHIYQPEHWLALLMSVVAAALVSFIVDRAARRTRIARRAAAESELIQTVAGSVLRGDNAIQALVDRTREALQIPGVRLVRTDAANAGGSGEAGDTVLATAGEPVRDERFTSIPIGETAVLELHGAELHASEQRLLAVIMAQLTAAMEFEELSETAKSIEPLAASDRIRGALLSALSHDLRKPLAAATAAIGGIRLAGPQLSEDDREELLATAEESLTSLGALVTDLLDVTRIQAGTLRLHCSPNDPAEPIAAALDELGAGPDRVTLGLNHDGALAMIDPVLLQRALVNLLTNAERHSPVDVPVHVSTSVFGDTVEIRVIDRGPGVEPERHDQMFVPFQRLGDTDNSTGLGLGLALSRGFVESMNGTLTPEATPGGGLTMVITVPRAAAATGTDAGDDTL